MSSSPLPSSSAAYSTVELFAGRVSELQLLEVRHTCVLTGAAAGLLPCVWQSSISIPEASAYLRQPLLGDLYVYDTTAYS
jgi:hypothetical protein